MSALTTVRFWGNAVAFRSSLAPIWTSKWHEMVAGAEILIATPDCNDDYR
jgi:hypothetical protein